MMCRKNVVRSTMPRVEDNAQLLISLKVLTREPKKPARQELCLALALLRGDAQNTISITTQTSTLFLQPPIVGPQPTYALN
jgi:hypothetical protein